MDTGRKKKNT